jgi:hypothetical protein
MSGSDRSPTISRRNFLGGAGVALGLPWLESLAAASASSGRSGPPRRLACLFFPNGVWQGD